MTRKAAKLTAAVLAAVFLWLLVTLPPRPATASGVVDEAMRARTVAGAFHVHSTRSDGSKDREAIAAAAARAGLQFVVMTDHGDATRQLSPAYINGVLCIDAVEISTNGGHLMALDMPPAPYPLGGEAAAVVEDVLRLGGMPVVTHPDSSKSELAWKDWGAPVAGLEWLNLDSGWRDESYVSVARVAVDYLVRPGPALVSLLERPRSALSRWDEVAAGRKMVGLAGHDVHGGLLPRREEGTGATSPGFAVATFSTYEASFSTFAVRVMLDGPVTGDADIDARRLLEATRLGHLYTAIDAIAAPVAVDYRATVGSSMFGMGDETAFEEGAALTFRSTLPPDAVQVLLRDGIEVAESRSGELRFTPPGPGAYRVEVRDPRWPIPWIATNPIYLRRSSDDKAPTAVEPAIVVSRAVDLNLGVVEKDPLSTADLSGTGSRALHFVLRPGERVSQYAALAVPLPTNLSAFDRITFTGRSQSPMRVSIQLRFESAGGARWRQSVYLAPEPRHVVVPLDRLLPADGPAARPAPELTTSLLFVVDLTNAEPGAQGRFEISDLRLATTR
jgi:hypothetical protein